MENIRSIQPRHSRSSQLDSGKNASARASQSTPLPDRFVANSARVIRLFGRGREIPRIEAGQCVPVGGSAFADHLHIYLKVDLENLTPILGSIRAGAERINRGAFS